MVMNRRGVFKGAGIAALGFSAPALGACATGSQATAQTALNDDSETIQIGANIAIANTEYGQVRGMILRGIHEFRGIPYGASTAGANRFMPPQPPARWEGVYDALWWGNSAPQPMEAKYARPFNAWLDHWNYDDVSEDCLRVNVWTPALDGRQRPVLVWFHGGGWSAGNGIEQDGYKGENFARKGDVVFVSVNHRLGPFGFSDFSSVGGEKYRHSGNAGALDMVEALRWVNRNIANFGGDPGNVTIMGQSGGGAKVCTLAAMPAARGMLHKVVPLSGSSVDAQQQSRTQAIGAAILQRAGLRRTQIDRLQEMPWQEYLALANAAAQGMEGGFSPVADGVNIPTGGYFTDPNGAAHDIPMLLSTTFHEWNMMLYVPTMETYTPEEAIESLRTQGGRMGRGEGLGDRAPAVYNAFAEAFPEASPGEICVMVSSNRQGVIRTADAKANQAAPIYLAWYGYCPSHYDGRIRATHCADICFWFNNTDLMYTHSGGGPRPRALSNRMSDALLAFMRTGDPNTASLPQWPRYDVQNRPTMILNDECEVQNDPDKAGRELI